MCGRFTLRTPAADVVRYFDVPMPSGLQLALRYNVAPSQTVSVVRQRDARCEMRLMRWGLIPSWADDTKIGYKFINARSETAFDKPSFRNAMKSRRCLIPADGFYEWQKLGKEKQPYYIGLRDRGLFAFAGLWERWRKGSQPINSCTILTTDANEVVRPLHDRMPVILKPETYAAWLDPEFEARDYLQSVLVPFDAEEMAAHPVSRVVNSPKNEGPECISAEAI